MYACKIFKLTDYIASTITNLLSSNIYNKTLTKIDSIWDWGAVQSDLLFGDLRVINMQINSMHYYFVRSSVTVFYFGCGKGASLRKSLTHNMLKYC